MSFQKGRLSKAKCIHKFTSGGFSLIHILHCSYVMLDEWKRFLVLLTWFFSALRHWSMPSKPTTVSVLSWSMPTGARWDLVLSVTWRHTHVTCCSFINVLSESDQLHICPSAFTSFSSFSTCRGNECSQKTGHDSTAQRLCQPSSTSTHVTLYTVI